MARFKKKISKAISDNSGRFFLTWVLHPLVKMRQLKDAKRKSMSFMGNGTEHTMGAQMMKVKHRIKSPLFISTLLVIWLMLISLPSARAQANPTNPKNELGTVYLITEKFLKDLKSDAEIPDDIVKKLQNLEVKEYVGKEKFIGVIKENIDNNLFVKHKSSILKYADTRNLNVNDLRVIKIDDSLILNKTFKVKVTNLKYWLEQNTDYKSSDCILFIEGKAFKGLVPDVLVSKELVFDLRFKKDSENKKAWKSLVSSKDRNNRYSRDVSVAVGIQKENQDQIQFQDSKEAKLIRMNADWYTYFMVFMIVGIISFIVLTIKSDVLRVSGPIPEGSNSKGNPNRKPFSLARTQMALWFIIVIVSYVFIWIVTDDLSNLTNSVLGLIGISAATGLGAIVVDSSKRNDQQKQSQILAKKKIELEQEKALLISEISTLTGTALADKQVSLKSKDGELTKISQELSEYIDLHIKPRESDGFINDLLHDDKGISFHRLQMIVWTIVLIGIFVFTVDTKLTMPEFDETLLALMGISGGTYIGFKLPEKEG